MWTWRLLRAVVPLLSVGLPVGGGAADAPGRPTYVAVIEDAIVGVEGSPHRSAIHVGFETSGTGWLPATLFPKRLRWSVCFDGRRLGGLESVLPESPLPGQRFQEAHEPAAGQKVPFMGKPSVEFAGWVKGEVYRPLVMTTTAKCGDPERWRRSAPPAQVVKRLAAAMREVAKDIYDCDGKGGEHPYAFPDSDITALEGFVSDAGTRIISLGVRLPRDLVQRCGDIKGPGWQPHTFAVFPNGRAEHLGSGMKVLDAGDYDGDGHSEVLFGFGSYNRDGYVLFYDSFRSSVRFEWGYH